MPPAIRNRSVSSDFIRKRQRWVPAVCLFSPLPAFSFMAQIKLSLSASLLASVPHRWQSMAPLLHSRTSFICIFSKIEFILISKTLQLPKWITCTSKDLTNANFIFIFFKKKLFLERSALKHQVQESLGQIVPRGSASLFFHLGLFWLPKRFKGNRSGLLDTSSISDLFLYFVPGLFLCGTAASFGPLFGAWLPKNSPTMFFWAERWKRTFCLCRTKV